MRPHPTKVTTTQNNFNPTIFGGEGSLTTPLPTESQLPAQGALDQPSMLPKQQHQHQGQHQQRYQQQQQQQQP